MSDELLLQALRERTSALCYALGRSIRQRFSDLAVLEADNCSFHLESFSDAGLCKLDLKANVHQHLAKSYCGPEDDHPDYLYDRPANTWHEVGWEGHQLQVIRSTWTEGHSSHAACWVVAPTIEVAESFYLQVCRWANQVRGEVLVFDGGNWSKDKELYEAIRNATFDNLILAGRLKEEILEDLSQFFNSRETYLKYRVPW